MAKRWICFLLVLVTALPHLTACTPQLPLPQDSDAQETQETASPETNQTKESLDETEKTESEMIPQSQWEQSITKILIIGNSSSNDVFFQLGRVFNAQGFGGKKYVLGFLYYSGCKFSQHVEFMLGNEAVYDYYKTSDTNYTRKEESTMKYALEDEPWDVIFLHPGGADDVLHEDLKLTFRRKIESYVNKYVPTEHVFGFHLRCPNPNEDAFFSDTWWRKAPSGYRTRLIEAFGNDDFLNQYTQTVNAVKANILDDPLYQYQIHTGAGFFYAHKVLGVSQFDLYRDYTHLSDFGRVLAAYCFYAQFTSEPIDEVKLDLVPAKTRQSHYASEGDLVLTDQMKQIIKESANWSLENTWTVPTA